jgi:4-diphosphocytidyl-2-C-methyl-D-erythritol kinase
MKLAAQLGSDVPFFMLGNAALGRGRGEQLTPLKSRLRGWVVVLKPKFGISTADAYRAIDREKPPPVARNAIRITTEAVRKGNLRNLSVYNDFEAVAAKMHPQIDELILALRGAGAVHSFMTGSGSAVIGLFRDSSKALAAKTSISRMHKVTGYLARLGTN